MDTGRELADDEPSVTWESRKQADDRAVSDVSQYIMAFLDGLVRDAVGLSRAGYRPIVRPRDPSHIDRLWISVEEVCMCYRQSRISGKVYFP